MVLIVEREAILVKEKGEWVQAVELVDVKWGARSGPASHERNIYENHSGV